MKNWRDRLAYWGIIVVPLVGLLAYAAWLATLFWPLISKILSGGG